jgi:hypothetical protein
MAQTGLTSMHFQTIKRVIRYAFNVVYAVFFPHFDDEEHEKQFYSQEWYLGKVSVQLRAYSCPSLISDS